MVQAAKLRDAVRSGAVDKVQAMLRAAGTSAHLLVQEPEPPMPKRDRPSSVRDSSSSSEDGYTAVHLAAKMNHVPVLDALLEACPWALNSEVESVSWCKDHQVKAGLTPIMVAARHGHVDAVKELVNRRAALNDKLENGNTALLIAAARGHSSALDALLEKEAKSTTSKDGADIDAMDHKGAVVPKMRLIEVTPSVPHGCCATHVVLCSEDMGSPTPCCCTADACRQYALPRRE